MHETPAAIHGKKIVFFDGVCTLCDRSVQALIRLDKKRRLLFASLQGETANALFHRHPNLRHEGDPDSIIFVRDFETSGERIYLRSSAALHIAKTLGGLLSIFVPLLLIPPFLRNPVYNLVATYRYRWFGKKESCRMPNATDKNRFLP